MTENSFAQNKIGTGNNLVLVKGRTFLSTSDTKNPDDYRQYRETVEDFFNFHKILLLEVESTMIWKNKLLNSCGIKIIVKDLWGFSRSVPARAKH